MINGYSLSPLMLQFESSRKGTASTTIKVKSDDPARQQNKGNITKG